jgi:diadenosine tetraphosphate (Ap4A) HIT family hydrolase
VQKKTRERVKVETMMLMNDVNVVVIIGLFSRANDAHIHTHIISKQKMKVKTLSKL